MSILNVFWGFGTRFGLNYSPPAVAVPLTKMAGKVSIEAFGTAGPALPSQWLLYLNRRLSSSICSTVNLNSLGRGHATYPRLCVAFAQVTASATRSDAKLRGCGLAARTGRVVSTTQIVSVAGSAQQRVPVEPPWPNVFSLHPGLLARVPMSKPSPRARMPWRLWLVIINLAVAGWRVLPLE
jgi:hypothetical protein